jgi:hypothetical protein
VLRVIVQRAAVEAIRRVGSQLMVGARSMCKLGVGHFQGAGGGGGGHSMRRLGVVRWVASEFGFAAAAARLRLHATHCYRDAFPVSFVTVPSPRQLLRLEEGGLSSAAVRALPIKHRPPPSVQCCHRQTASALPSPRFLCVMIRGQCWWRCVCVCVCVCGVDDRHPVRNTRGWWTRSTAWTSRSSCAMWQG